METPSGKAFLQQILLQTRGFEKKKIYVWLKSNGEILAPPGENFEELSKLSKEMQTIADECGYDVRLVEFGKNSVKMRINATPNPEDEEDFIRGGCAIGDSSSPDNVEDIKNEFLRIFNRQYAHAQDSEFWVDNNTAYAKHKNVCCWVTLSDNLDIDGETGLKNRWSAYVTMIKEWNDEYHDVHLGDFYCGSSAVKKAFLGFIKFQLSEQTIEDFF